MEPDVINTGVLVVLPPSFLPCESAGVFSSLDEERERGTCVPLPAYGRLLSRFHVRANDNEGRTLKHRTADLGLFFFEVLAAGALPGHARWQIRERRSVLAFLPSGEGSKTRRISLSRGWPYSAAVGPQD